MIVDLINTAIGYEPPGGAQVVTGLIVAVVVVVVFLALGFSVSFLFFGYLAYMEDFQDMPHEENHNEH